MLRPFLPPRPEDSDPVPTYPSAFFQPAYIPENSLQRRRTEERPGRHRPATFGLVGKVVPRGSREKKKVPGVLLGGDREETHLTHRGVQTGCVPTHAYAYAHATQEGCAKEAQEAQHLRFGLTRLALSMGQQPPTFWKSRSDPSGDSLAPTPTPTR